MKQENIIPSVFLLEREGEGEGSGQDDGTK